MSTKYYYLLYPLFFLLIACSEKKVDKESGENVSIVLPDKLIQVKVSKLEYSVFGQEIIANGTVVASQKADLKFEASGVVSTIFVKNGAHVTKGQKIAMLDQFKLKNSLQQAKDNFDRSRLDLQDVLIGQGYKLADSLKVPAEVMKIAKTRSLFDQNKALLDLADYNLKNSILYAPFSGVIANLFTREQNLPPSSEPFCTVINNQSLEAEFTVLENELPLLKVGDKVMVSPFAISDYTSTGYISEINPTVDENGLVRVKAHVGAGGRQLYDGMNIKVRIQRSLEKQLVIPKSALVLRTNRKVVFTLQNGLAKWNEVETGFENSEGFTIVSGLNSGDSIIYDGNINLAHDSPVQRVD